MSHYKSPDNKVYFLDSAEFEHLLPTGCVQITDAEATALQPQPGANDIVKEQISVLESTITPRRLREATLTDAGKTWLADVDSQIAVLRATLTK